MKHFLHSFINSKHSIFHFYARYVLVFVKEHKLVQYIVLIESIFSSHCTV